MTLIDQLASRTGLAVRRAPVPRLGRCTRAPVLVSAGLPAGYGRLTFLFLH